MSAADFPKCLQLVLREEGGNDDDPLDHGGRTSRGITQSEWNTWINGHPGLPSDVWRAPQEEIEKLYRAQYWLPYCDRMPSGLDLVFFDFAVNSGRQQAVKSLQRALGVSPDGMLGIKTWAAIESASDYELIQSYSDRRRTFYHALAQFPRFGNGWIARTDRIEKAALGMVMSPEATMPDTREYLKAVTEPISIQTPVAESPKANPLDVAPPPIETQTANVGTIAGSIGGGISDQLQQASTAIQPLSDTFLWAKYACLAITLICVGFAIYAVIHNRKMKEAV